MKTYFVVQHGSGSVVLQDDRTTFGYGKPADFGYEEASAMVVQLSSCQALAAHDCDGCGCSMLDYLNESFLCSGCIPIYKRAFSAGETAGFEQGLRQALEQQSA